MNQATHESKTVVIKTLAIIGFIATITLSVWVAVQVVRVIPNAFSSSLASIADSISNYRTVDELVVTTEKSIVNTGESFEILWNDLEREGNYHFTYVCVEGVSLDIRAADGNVVHMNCTDTLTVPENVHSIEVLASSEKRRFTDVPFSVAFTDLDTDDELFSEDSKVTVVNATIPQSADLAADNSTSEEEITVVTPQPTPAEEAPTPAKPITIETSVSFLPTSHEDGFTDLKMSYLGVGSLDDNVFTPKATFVTGTKGALKFEVKNIGTKTSDDWTFTATLPSGFVFNSDTQAALKPNERAEFTLGFDVVAEESTQKIKATLTEENDTNETNDSFNWSVKVTD